MSRITALVLANYASASTSTDANLENLQKLKSTTKTRIQMLQGSM